MAMLVGLVSFAMLWYTFTYHLLYSGATHSRMIVVMDADC